MKISAIKFYNIRSFGEWDNYLTLEEGKTAIIGVNESGKSNILEAIGHLNFSSKLGNYYNNIKNLSSPEAEIKILVQMSMKEEELQRFGVLEHEDKTLLTFRVGQVTAIHGTLSNVIAQNESVIKAIDFWNNHTLSDLYSLTGDNRGVYISTVNQIKNCNEEIVLVSQLDILTRNFKKDVDSKECIECINNLKAELLKIYSLFPVILYRNWNGITPVKASYINTEAVKDLADSNSSLYKLIQAAGISVEEMTKAFELPEGNARYTLRYSIEQRIADKICKDFKRFYPKSELELLVRFEANKLCVHVLTGDMIMSINERSNGLRWYLGLFIELVSMDYKNRDILYLLDEPGVFLHVNAQKELISLFNELCESNGQLVYTTHLPYMLDTENLYCIRRVEKDDKGQSHIFNRVYSGGLELPSREETLTPLIRAMGCDMKYAIDVSARKNIITEGITDKMYLEAGIKALNISEKLNILPSNGAASIPNIVSILIGWGCDYKVVLDYDSEGFTQFKRLVSSFGEEIKEQIVFVAEGQIPDDVNDRTITAKTIESIMSDKDMNKLETPYDGSKITKTITAMEFRSKVLSGEVIIDEETTANYQRLLQKLEIII